MIFLTTSFGRIELSSTPKMPAPLLGVMMVTEEWPTRISEIILSAGTSNVTKNTEHLTSLKKLPSTPQTKDTFTIETDMTPEDYEFEDINEFEKAQEEAVSEVINELWEMVKGGELELYSNEQGEFTFGKAQ